jgi:CubicO group peptidase (beta-lactamase class C family)
VKDSKLGGDRPIERTNAVNRIATALAVILTITMQLTAHSDPIDDYIRLRMRKESIPGLAFAIVKDGKLIRSGGYGVASLELKVPVTAETAFQIGSLTKQFTATGIMLLAQQGKLTLDDPVTRYFPDAPASWQGMTLRHLLTHTSGLPSDGLRTTDKTRFADFTEAEVLQGAESSPLAAKPGEQFQYSNLGYDLLAIIIGRVGGTPYADFVRQRLFEPLGMTATRFNDRLAVIPNRASGYLLDRAGMHICLQYSPTRFLGSASIVSTAHDLALWDQSLINHTLVTPASLKQMWTPMTLNNGSKTDYGLGWYVSADKGHTNIHHNGAVNGFLANISRFVDDRLTVIVLVNQSGLADTQRIATGIARLFIPTLRPSPPPHAHRPVPADPALLAACAGRYEFYNNVLLTVTAGKEGLLGQLPWGEADDYLPIAANTFWQPEDGIQLTVLKNAAGEITGLRVHHDDGGEHVAGRIGPLVHTVLPQPDPDPALTRQIETALKAAEQGADAIAQVPGFAPGARRDFMAAGVGFSGLQSISYIGTFDVSGRGIERHGSPVASVRYYALNPGMATRYMLVYLTADHLMTDEDPVDD